MSDLFYLAQHPQGSFILLHITQFPSFLRLTNISLHVSTIFSLSTHGHLGCFHMLATINNAAVTQEC